MARQLLYLVRRFGRPNAKGSAGRGTGLLQAEVFAYLIDLPLQARILAPGRHEENQHLDDKNRQEKRNGPVHDEVILYRSIRFSMRKCVGKLWFKIAFS